MFTSSSMIYRGCFLSIKSKVYCCMLLLKLFWGSFILYDIVRDLFSSISLSPSIEVGGTSNIKSYSGLAMLFLISASSRLYYSGVSRLDSKLRDLLAGEISDFDSSVASISFEV